MIRVPSLDESQNQLQTQSVIEQIDLQLFKTQPCQQQIPHNTKQCVFFHGIMDRRRFGIYSSEICECIKQAKQCSNYNMCQKSHNLVEVMYRAEKFKSKFCQHLFNPHSCEYGFYCPYAHFEKEITCELIHNLEFDDDYYLFHFKTVWCPFSFFEHNQEKCSYAHNFSDFRRKPHLYNYTPQQCPRWQQSSEMVSRYEDLCTIDCNKCHGNFELLYHPLYYKTKACSKQQACTTEVGMCPFYHGRGDQRQMRILQKLFRLIPSEIINGIFRFIPRNRVVSGTFKSPLPQLFQPQQPVVYQNPLAQMTQMMNSQPQGLEQMQLQQLVLEFQNLMNLEGQQQNMF